MNWLNKTQYNLHIDGFTIHKNAVDIDETVVDRFKGQINRARPIFNNSNRNDMKRMQFRVKRGDLPRINKVLLFIKENYPNLNAVEWNILWSKKCQRQQAHSDYEPDIKMLNISKDQMPLSALVPLDEGCKLIVWKKSINLINKSNDDLQRVKTIKPTIVTLNPGDILIFRADLIHAGSEYDEPNIRLHAFLDSDAITRQHNRTYIIGKHAPNELHRIIQEM